MTLPSVLTTSGSSTPTTWVLVVGVRERLLAEAGRGTGLAKRRAAVGIEPALRSAFRVRDAPPLLNP